MIYGEPAILLSHAHSSKSAMHFKSGSGGKQQGHVKKEHAPQKDGYQAPGLLCRQCLAYITRHEERIETNGAHHHTFANPYGIVFEIGCFKEAGGCAAVGAPTTEFSWFSGYHWQMALCGTCTTHLGWRFSSGDAGAFYGLILDHLVESASDPEK